MTRKTILSVVMVLAVCMVVARGQVPGMISYQGVVTVRGTNYSGTGFFKFAIVSGSGAVSYWSNDGTSVVGTEPTASVAVEVEEGLFNLFLGDTSMPNMTLAVEVFTIDGRDDARLRIWFSEDAAGPFERLMPDQPLGSAPYALIAARVPAGSIGENQLANGAVTREKLGMFAVGPMNIADQSVNTGNIADNAIISSKIQDGSIGFMDINQNSATSGQVMRWNGSVWTAAAPLSSYAENGTFSTPPAASGTDSIAQGLGALAEGAHSVVGGGQQNIAAGSYATVAGGERNNANSQYATVAGGIMNSATEYYTTVGGGAENLAGGEAATVAGGAYNNASGKYAAIPGGESNMATGNYSFAAGRWARASHAGSFIWGDSISEAIASTTSNQVLFRCNGGMQFQNTAGNQYVRWTPGTGHGLQVIANTTQTGKAAIHGESGSSGITINSYAGVQGESLNGRGVVGVSSTREGMLGYSASGVGVHGQSASGYGVRAWSRDTAALKADGYVEADSYRFNRAKTNYWSYSGDNFRPRSINSGTSFFSAGGTAGAYFQAANTADDDLLAPLQLPHGATITRFEASFYDNAAIDLNASILVHTKTGSYSHSTLGQVSSSGLSGTGSSSQNINHVVNNATSFYEVYVRPAGGKWETVASNLRIIGITITYTTTEAH